MIAQAIGGVSPALRTLVLLMATAQALSGSPRPDETSGKSADHDGDPNRLIHETSPYLRQHAYNPVDWYPWGDEAFAKAKLEDKPIFLSVGYSTCYWCHVMEKESFENPAVAAILNQYYVAVKVDREERPDVDGHYMPATQLLTGSGGWPNSLWLTPEGKPWMAGTYFPKQRFMTILDRLADLWKERRADVEQEAKRLAAHMEQIGAIPSGISEEPTMALVEEASRQLQAEFDERHGGFGSAPKFPPHGTLRLLLSLSNAEGATLPESVTRTLDAMWLGGIRDHIGGGFHRYSTDEQWLLPHFEKMLYDNAQVLRNYAEAAAATGEPRYHRAVAEVFRWLIREMVHPEGGFYSAIDSGGVGEEGATYLWTLAELRNVLGEEDAALFAGIYGMEKRGNFREESTRERTGANIPHLEKPIDEIAAARGLSPKALRDTLAAQRAELLEARRFRSPPHRDDKILTSWNGLMIEALAYAGRTLETPAYTEAAERAAEFIMRQLWPGDGLLRSYRDGKAHQPAFLDDHAYLAAGLLELHAATGNERWLRAARRLGDTLLAEFADSEDGGFFLTAASVSTPFARSKVLQSGGNLPDPNGTVARVLLELSKQAGESRYARAAAATRRAFAGLAAGNPYGTEEILLAILHAERYEAEATAESSPMTTPPDGFKSQQDDPRAANAFAKEVGPVVFALSAATKSCAPGENIAVRLSLKIDPGWHLYGENPELGFLVPVQVEPMTLRHFEIGELVRPEPREKFDPVLEKIVRTYEGEIDYTIPYRVHENAPAGPNSIAINVRVQACDADRCLTPQTVALRLPVEIR